MFYGTIVNGTVNAGSLFVISQKELTNTNVSFDGTSTLKFKRAGMYRVHIDVTGNGTEAGNLIVSAVINGTQSTYAQGVESATGTTDYHNISFETIIDIRTAPMGFATLSFNETGVGMNVLAGNVIIERIA